MALIDEQIDQLTEELKALRERWHFDEIDFDNASIPEWAWDKRKLLMERKERLCHDRWVAITQGPGFTHPLEPAGC